jgi:hypothetical protein
LSEQPTCKTILPKFISMENNLTATMNNHILYGGFDQWHTMYKTKLVIPSTQTDNLPQHKLFLCGYAVLNRTVWYIINWGGGGGGGGVGGGGGGGGGGVSCPCCPLCCLQPC